MAKAQEDKGFFASVRETVVQYYRETVGELRKVVWPTREEAFRLTGIVLAVIFAMAILLGGCDWLFAQIFRVLISL